MPDLPGCTAVAESRVEVMRLVREAIDFHMESLKIESALFLENTNGPDVHSLVCPFAAFLRMPLWM